MDENGSSPYQYLQPSITPSFLVPNIESSDKLDQTEKDTSKKYNCDVCNFSDIQTEGALLSHKKFQHMKTKIRSVSLQCAYCNDFCKSRNELENHMKIHCVSGKEKHKCNICDAMFSSFPMLADHRLTHCRITDGTTCVQCKTSLTNIKLFYDHHIAHSNGPTNGNTQIFLPANCVICCQTLQNHIELKLHANFHLKHLLKKFLCCICNDEFESIGNQNGEPDKLLFNRFLGICPKCTSDNDPRLTKTKSETPDSPKSNSKSPNSKMYLLHEKNNLECRLCKQFFPTALKLQLHLIEHSYYGMNQYNCYVCSAVFTGANGLRSHMLQHGLQSRPYECEYCQIKFFFRSELENHAIIHNVPPPPPNKVSSVKQSSIETIVKPQQEGSKFEACPYCHNLFLQSTFYTDHVNNCSCRTDINNIQDGTIDNNPPKRMKTDYITNTSKQ